MTPSFAAQVTLVTGGGSGLGRADEVASQVCFLLSDEASLITGGY